MIKNDLRSLWEQRLAEYQNSGKTIKAWCQDQELRENQFYYWRKKLRDQSETEQPVKWLSLKLDNNKQADLASDSITIHIGQVTVKIKKGFDQQLFREIIQILQMI
jgi:transposase-like protein